MQENQSKTLGYRHSDPASTGSNRGLQKAGSGNEFPTQNAYQRGWHLRTGPSLGAVTTSTLKSYSEWHRWPRLTLSHHPAKTLGRRKPARQASLQWFILKGTVSCMPSALPAPNGTWQCTLLSLSTRSPGPCCQRCSDLPLAESTSLWLLDSWLIHRTDGTCQAISVSLSLLVIIHWL